MSLKNKLKNNQLTVGSWITLAQPAIAEIMARSNVDWLVVDMEHSVISLQEAEMLIRIIELCNCTPLVRLSNNEPVQIKRIMDAGAHGIIVPMVNTLDDVERAVEALHYPPTGKRGVGLARAQKYGEKFEEYKEWLSNESILIVQIEHYLAIENLDKILSHKYVDGFIVGPYDLSASLGIAGDFNHPSMIEAIDKITKIAKKYSVSMGYHIVPPDPKAARDKIKQGYTFIAYSTDFLMLGESCRNGISEIRKYS